MMLVFMCDTKVQGKIFLRVADREIFFRIDIPKVIFYCYNKLYPHCSSFSPDRLATLVDEPISKTKNAN